MILSSPKAAEPVPIAEYDLAAIIDRTPPGGLIKIPPGKFLLRCDGTVVIKPGVKIIADSPWSTQILRDPNPLYTENNQPIFLGRGDCITIENIGFDSGDNGGFAVPGPWAYSHVRIQGRSFRVINCHGIRPTGNYAARTECWSFFMETGERYATGIVRDCSVTDVRGDYVDGFSSSGACVFDNCRVYFPTPAGSAAPPQFVGFQASDGSQVINCHTVGGTAFFYTDTNSSRNMRISGCTGTGLVCGVAIAVPAGQSCDGLTVDGCTFELVPNLAGNRVGVVVSGPGAKRNVRVLNSVIRWTDGLLTDSPTLKFAANVPDGSGHLYQNNAIDAGMIWGENATALNNSMIARAPIAPIP